MAHSRFEGRGRLLSFTLAVVVAVSACTTTKQAVKPVREATPAGGFELECSRVTTAWDKGYYAEGDRHLDRVLASWPEAARAHALRARSLQRQGFPRAAEDAMVQATKLEPTRAEHWLELAQLRLDLDLAAGAQAAAMHALELEPSREAYLVMARALRAQRRWLHATLAYRQALDKGAPLVTTLSEASSLCLDAQDLAADDELTVEWLAMAAGALELDQSCAAAHSVIARWNALQGNFDVALAHARSALEVDARDDAMRRLCARLERPAAPAAK